MSSAAAAAACASAGKARPGRAGPWGCPAAAAATCRCSRRSRSSTGPPGGCSRRRRRARRWPSPASRAPSRTPGRRSAISCARAASPLLHHPLRGAAGRGGVVLPAGHRARLPGRVPVRLPRQPRLLSVTGSPQWRTVTGGSRRYVELIAAGLAQVRLSSPVRSVRRYPDGVECGRLRQPARFRRGGHRHPPRPGAAAARPAHRGGSARCSARSATRPNQAVLHTDSRVLPPYAAVRASWTTRSSCSGGQTTAPARVSYYMNRLQGLPPGQDYIVTLGGRRTWTRRASSP